MRTAYLDCFAGISGDMLLGALLDAGVPESVLIGAVSALPLEASLRIEKVDRSGIFATKVHVLEGERLAEAAPSHHQENGQSSVASHAPTHEHTQKHSHAHGDDHVVAGIAHEHTHAHAHPHPHENGHSHTHEPVRSPDHGHSHPHAHAHGHGRSLTQIRELIQASGLTAAVKDFAIGTFEMLGQSEAKIHNVPVDEIHFHEVGAVDAIVDIVAASAAIDYLAQQGGLTWFCSALNVGGGMVECAHGIFPVPAPATADLLCEMPTYSAHIQKELVTPTGAALLRMLAPEFGPQPLMRIHTIGYGAGTRNPKGFPNVLRLSLGETETATETETDASKIRNGQAGAREIHSPVPELTRSPTSVMVLETALDDATPQLVAHVAERLLEAGALDVMLTPVSMKKGRPATLLTALCDPERSAAIESLLLRETTTLGIRKHLQERACLDRRHASVSTSFGEIRIKVGMLEGEELNAMPEYEDCRAAAARHRVPLKQVMQAAVAAYVPGS